jgi:NitT/TauT family transport system permease protein
MARAERSLVGYRAASLTGFAALWWLLALLAHNPRLLPSPPAVAAAAWDQTLHAGLVRDFAATFARVIAAFVLSMLAGCLIGYVAGRRPRANALIDPILTLTLNLPLLVVIVLSYIWIGLNEAAAILAVAIAKTPNIAVTVREGARALDHGFDELATVFALPRARRWRFVVLPQLAPYLAAAGRGGLAITWKIVLVVELLGRPSGVGYALNLAFQNFDVAIILAYGLLFAAVMLAIELFILQPWETSTRGWRSGA